jgi:hypothetical protein
MKPTRNPSYRPRFRHCHWAASLAGTLACLGAMVLVDALWDIVAVVLMGAL